jgi:hypothetical protein
MDNKGIVSMVILGNKLLKDGDGEHIAELVRLVALSQNAQATLSSATHLVDSLQRTIGQNKHVNKAKTALKLGPSINALFKELLDNENRLREIIADISWLFQDKT